MNKNKTEIIPYRTSTWQKIMLTRICEINGAKKSTIIDKILMEFIDKYSINIVILNGENIGLKTKGLFLPKEQKVVDVNGNYYNILDVKFLID